MTNALYYSDHFLTDARPSFSNVTHTRGEVMMLFKLFANNAKGFRDSMNPAARARILQVTAYNITLKKGSKQWKRKEGSPKDRLTPQRPQCI